MRISYDPEADALHIRFRGSKVHHTKELDRDTLIDYDKDDRVVGVELLFVRERSPDLLKGIKVENLTVA